MPPQNTMPSNGPLGWVVAVVLACARSALWSTRWERYSTDR
jgi:hypothetical protein